MVTALVTILVTVFGLVAGWLSAHLVHSYVEEADTEIAVRVDPTCSHCEASIALGDTAPPRWWLRGTMCPLCNHRLAWTWIAVQLAVPVGSLAMLAAWGPNLVLIPFLWLVPVLVVAAVVDARLMLIPRRVAWIGAGVGAALIAVVSVIGGEPGAIKSALVGGAAYFGFLFVMSMISPRAMGFGDVRFSLILGLYLGWISVLLPAVGLFVACILGVVLGLGVRIGSRGQQRHFPFGPGLALGTLIVIAFHEPILSRLIVT